MRTRIILQFATLLVLLLGTSINGLFFHYPKNALLDFFTSLHHKKEEKKPAHNIHHYHVHYYPVQKQIWAKALKAPTKHELDKFHSNHLESLGWGEHEYNTVPEPEIYSSSYHDAWPESSLIRPSIWDEEPPNYPPHQSLEQPEIPKAGIIVQVPLHQNIFVQHPPAKEEAHNANPLVSFFQGIKRLKNSLFSHHESSDEKHAWSEKEVDKTGGYVVYVHPEFARKL